jgi:tRNA-2-methylthio-N6-dimethylallyladenosine synthase
MSKTYFIKTWGCQMNVADSQRIAGFYTQKGWQKAKTWQEADEIILVTCSVRASAENRVLGFVRNFNKEFPLLTEEGLGEVKNSRHPELDGSPSKKKKAPKLILTGCMLHHTKKRLQKLFPGVSQFSDISQTLDFQTPYIRNDKKHAFVPISSGCNSFCTYCIVPMARGREKSRPETDIISEIKKLVKDGFSQFTILGQNVNSYGLEKVGMGMRKRLEQGRDLPSPQSQYKSFQDQSPFSKLLAKICTINGVKKLAFMSSNPWDFYDDIINVIKNNPIIDRHFHIAVQSGDDEILTKMNRGYTAKQFENLINKIRSKIPQATFSTDIIVGFPGETQKQFQNTVKFCQKLKFKLAYINKYSPRPGTASAKLYKDDVDIHKKKRRWKILEELINKPNLK